MYAYWVVVVESPNTEGGSSITCMGYLIYESLENLKIICITV